MLDRLALVLRWLGALCRVRGNLALENLALRQQLTVLSRRHPRPRLTSVDRCFWVMLRRVWARWTDALIIVKPDTVVGWHRAGFRLYWRFRSRGKTRVGRRRTGQEIRNLIQRMAAENGTWGAPRIHGELLKLGVAVSERTVSRYLPDQPRKRASGPSWLAFLRNHREAIAAMDLFTVPTVSCRLLYVFFVISHARRQILRADVTEHPTASWITQQLREAFPGGSAPKYLLLDRDSTFDRQVLVSVENMSITPVRTAFRSPWQNGVAERWVESCRRDVMDHVLVLNERHARRLLAEYLTYYHEDRTHYAWRRNRRSVGPSPSVPLHNRRSLGFPEWAVCITATNGPRTLERGLTIGPSFVPVTTRIGTRVHASQNKADVTTGVVPVFATLRHLKDSWTWTPPRYIPG